LVNEIDFCFRDAHRLTECAFNINFVAAERRKKEKAELCSSAHHQRASETLSNSCLIVQELRGTIPKM
jgi:hypothetical protein